MWIPSELIIGIWFRQWQNCSCCVFSCRNVGWLILAMCTNVGSGRIDIYGFLFLNRVNFERCLMNENLMLIYNRCSLTYQLTTSQFLYLYFLLSLTHRPLLPTIPLYFLGALYDISLIVYLYLYLTGLLIYNLGNLLPGTLLKIVLKEMFIKLLHIHIC